MLVETLRLIVVLGFVLGAERLAASHELVPGSSPQARVLLVTALGAAVGYLVGGVVARGTERLMRGAEERVARHHVSEIVAATLGFLVGGVASAVLIWPLLVFLRPASVAGPVAAFLGVVVTSFTVRLGVRKRSELFGVLGVMPSRGGRSTGCLLDTSAAIDGRVLALYRAGLLPQPLNVPAFVIWEMQGIADSQDPLRRRRGQRGLDVLTSLREAGAEVRLVDEDPAGTTDPDAKLLVVARRHGLPIVTADSNLARAAELQGIAVLNLHTLADLLRPPVLPGEHTHVQLIREGRERGQGIGYLDDGTMVVVEGGAGLLGQVVDVEVTSVQQSRAGRMLFARLPEEPHTLRDVR